MEMPQELKNLLPRKPKGKVAAPRLTLTETQELRLFFISRKIANQRIAEVLGVTGQAISNWWALGVPESRFEELKGLMDKILDWERLSGCRFPG